MEEQKIKLTNNNLKNPTKTNKRIKILLIIFSAILFILLMIFIYYRTHIDISRKYEKNFDYNLESDIIEEYNIDDFFNFDTVQDPNTLFISIPKKYIYQKIIKLDNINNELNDNYKLKIKRIGLISDENDENFINLLLDCNYNNIINVFVLGELEYEITEQNGLNVYLNSINIGKNLPKSIVDKYLPSINKQLIYEVKSENVQILNSQILQLDKINSVDFNNENLDIEFNIYDNVRQIIINTYGEDENKIQFLAKSLIPNIIETFKINLNKLKS